MQHSHQNLAAKSLRARKEQDNMKFIKEGNLGSMLNVYTSKGTKELQKIAVEETRLGIPLLFGYDVIHGFKTIFPINLGIASSWDLKDVEEVARISAEEASASGVLKF